jgi:hypothetical protein
MSESENEVVREYVIKEYLPYQQRVIDEKVELEAKIIRLTDFLDRDSDIDQLDRMLLWSQLSSMKTYNSILSMRIARF